MSKPIKIVLGVLAALVVLLAAGVAYLAATFNPDDYKPLLVERVQRDYGRTLAIPGKIGLSVFPNLGITLGEVSVSEAGRAERFASLKSARVSLAVMPLLQRRVVVDEVAISGLRATVVRFADGRTSIDDLTKPKTAEPAPAPEAGTPQQPLAFDIAGLKLDDAELVFDDRQAKRRVELTKASITTGRLTPGQPTDTRLQAHLKTDAPAVDVQLDLRSRVLLDPAAKHYALTGLDAAVTGQLAALQKATLKLGGDADVKLEPLRLDVSGLTLAVQGQPAGSTLDAKLAIPKLLIGDKAIQGQKLALQATLKQAAGTVSADLALPALDLARDADRIDLKPLTLKLGAPNPRGGTIALALQGGVSLQVEKQRVDLNLAGTLDESRIDAKLGLSNFAAPAWRFDIGIDQLDVDRYRKPAPATPEGAPAGPEAPIDLAALKSLNASGSLKVGALQASGLKLRTVRVDLKAGGGQVELNPLAAELYEGRTTGSVVLQAAAVPRISVRQTLTGVSVGPLLKDLLQRDTLTGRGDVALDVTAQGATVTAMKQALGGSARLALRDGAVRGFNIAQAIRDAKAKLGGGGGAGTGTGSRDQSTDFSELGGNFRIERGVAHTDDLQAKSPLLRVGAVGDVDLGQSRLDVVVKATVVPTLQGQGGPELQALRGQTVPVKLSGPFTAIGWKIDFAGMVTEEAKQKLEDKAKQKLGDKLKGLLGR